MVARGQLGCSWRTATYLKPSRTSTIVRCSSSHRCPFHPISQGCSWLPQEYCCSLRPRPSCGSSGMLAPRTIASKNLGPFRVLRLRFCSGRKSIGYISVGLHKDLGLHHETNNERSVSVVRSKCHHIDEQMTRAVRVHKVVD